MNGLWQRGESTLCLICNRWGQRPWVRQYFSVISRLGDGVFWYVLMALLVLFDGLRGLVAITHMAATGAAALLLYWVLKRWTRRPRPFVADRRILPLMPPLDEFSFPSGHTLHAVVLTLIALVWYPVLVWLLIPFTASVGASRVVLGLHYPSDVLAATWIATLLAALSLFLAGLPSPLSSAEGSERGWLRWLDAR